MQRNRILGCFALIASLATNELSAATWPRTRAGDLAGAWTEAFAAGEPAMRVFFEQSLAARSLAERSIDQRLATYADLRKRLGKLELGRLVAHPEGELHVILLTEGGDEVPAVFRVEKASDGKLLSVQLTLTEHRHGGHGGHGGLFGH